MSSLFLGKSENGSVSGEHLGGLNQILTKQDFKISICVSRQILDQGTLSLRS
ncbi:hypothetical protein [Pectobacterium cacticida]|uniref:hypothetical protein n=1 Tax=Pectobacterium cacticida TaxID=69221 RepID=UPI003987C10F